MLYNQKRHGGRGRGRDNPLQQQRKHPASDAATSKQRSTATAMTAIKETKDPEHDRHNDNEIVVPAITGADEWGLDDNELQHQQQYVTTPSYPYYHSPQPQPSSSSSHHDSIHNDHEWIKDELLLSSWWPQAMTLKLACLSTANRLRLPLHHVTTTFIDDDETNNPIVHHHHHHIDNDVGMRTNNDNTQHHHNQMTNQNTTMPTRRQPCGDEPNEIVQNEVATITTTTDDEEDDLEAWLDTVIS